jgi:hypothetical protein
MPGRRAAVELAGTSADGDTVGGPVGCGATAVGGAGVADGGAAGIGGLAAGLVEQPRLTLSRKVAAAAAAHVAS